MEGKAILRFARISPTKVSQVLKSIRGKSVANAISTLDFTVKAAAPIIKKTILSALSNAGAKADISGLRLKQAYVGYGPTLKRFRAGSFGRPSPRRKKTTHLTVVIGD